MVARQKANYANGGCNVISRMKLTYTTCSKSSHTLMLKDNMSRLKRNKTEMDIWTALNLKA
uniref:Uncharacterized protein n=1 Tax=Arion vulgaris TaxID=1028688 RepID=A0A0B6ZHZ0_9EUPU